MEKLRNWVTGTIVPITTDSNMKVTGTVIHQACMVNHLYNNATNFKKISMTAVKDPQYEEIEGRRHIV